MKTHKLNLFFIRVTFNTSFLIWLFCLWVISACSNEANELPQSKKTQQSIGLPSSDTVSIDLQLIKKQLVAHQAGTIERIVEKEQFKKGELLVQFDNYDAFVELSGKKESYKEDVNKFLLSIPENLSRIKQKWSKFEQSISAVRLLPSFPEIEFREEAALLSRTRIILDYNTLVKEEKQLKTYFIVAPKDGFSISTRFKAGDRVLINEKILTYTETKANIKLSSNTGFSKNAIIKLKNNIESQLHCTIIKWDSIQAQKHVVEILLSKPIQPNEIPDFWVINSSQYEHLVPLEFINANNQALVKTIQGTRLVKVFKRGGKNRIISSSQNIELIQP
jgi:hypothetical protein